MSSSRVTELMDVDDVGPKRVVPKNSGYIITPEAQVADIGSRNWPLLLRNYTTSASNIGRENSI